MEDWQRDKRRMIKEKMSLICSLANPFGLPANGSMMVGLSPIGISVVDCNNQQNRRMHHLSFVVQQSNPYFVSLIPKSVMLHLHC